MKKLLFLTVFLLTIMNCFSQQKHSFEIKDGSFIYDGRAIQIHSGEMHFARVPKQYWRHRLQMIKAMGLNTVATYVFWNYHETAPGVWDFKTGNKNIREFIKTAQEVGLMVILRPGPYACAEWEFGGYPWWLVKEKALVIRSYNKAFLDSCKTYINKLAQQVKDLQMTKGGPIIMVQAENEFGSYVAQRKDISLKDHKAYSAAIKQELIDAGFSVPLFTSDGSSLFNGGTIAGALPTANGEDNIETLKKVVNEYHDGKGPYMVAEFYPGWLDHWAEPFQKVSTQNVIAQTEKYLKAGVSFSFYMIHGGTNFGFTSGANYNGEHNIQPDITSYDYDAPINEAGWETPKYKALRQLFQQYVSYKIPSVPAPIPVISISSIQLNKAVDLFDFKEKIIPVESDTPQTFESINHGYGYVLYSKKIEKPIKGKLRIDGLRDYATIFVNGKKVATLNRVFNNYSCDINLPLNATLSILVENMGRINYGAEIVHNLKGIISPVLIDSAELKGNWKMYRLPMNAEPDLHSFKNRYVKSHPVIYSGSFSLIKTGDTFLDMRSWEKGIVFVNGQNLGRYWNAGPQQTLYLPGCWLHKGRNIITIFEQENNEEHTAISAIATPILDELRK
ncbi:beta-galactosidase [Ginsengibacter hankyongi]|uniref:Beta-galactosidase n=1 Tax=Ginsengibacter hankyongi TaxID=2607284 RepID=A0A5J5IDZ7_9BACT|nr:beta-galactosidase [Ginsengibacter hankyongi]KAA9036289.1 beta-galactosidase [Ginsengibacter hankyongi]